MTVKRNSSFALAGIVLAHLAAVSPSAIAPLAPRAMAQERSPQPGNAQRLDRWLATLRVPGIEHKRLNALVGTWTTKIKNWPGPDAKPIELTGRAIKRWTLDGHFLEEQAQNKTQNNGRFQSRGFIGFNRLTQLYEHVLMTNAATGLFIERGRYDPASKVIRTSGRDTDPVTGAIILNATELRIESPQQHTVTAYATGRDGRRWKQLEIIYARKPR